MKYKVIISNAKHTFPIKGLNELLNGRLYNFRTKKYHNPVKQENDKVCRMAVHKSLRGVKLKTPIKCIYYIYVADKRHDRGNVYAAVEKSALDSLQQCNVLSSDGYDFVVDSEFHTEVCKNNPRVELIIEEVE